MYRFEQDCQQNEVNTRTRPRYLERNMFEKNSRIVENNQKDDVDSENNNRGEITGHAMSINDLDFGMPYRSASCNKKMERDSMENNRADFDLFNAECKDFNVAYNDPSGGSSLSFSNINSKNEKIIPEGYGTDICSFVSISTNKFTLSFFNSLKDRYGEKFCITPYGVYNIFAVLAVASNGKTGHDIMQYFDMPSKKNLLSGLLSNKNIYGAKEMAQHFFLKNMLLIDNNLPVSDKFIKFTEKLIDIHPLSTETNNSMISGLNNFIQKISNGTVNPISPKIFEKASQKMICANIGLFKPIWKISFNKSFDSKFMGTEKNRIVRMLGQIDTQHAYYEDNLNQYLELKLLGDKIVMGIVLPKEMVIPELNFDELTMLLKHIKPTFINEVIIPVFTQQIKLKLTTMLNNSGLDSIFGKSDFSELIDKPCAISDVVQNITVIVANSGPENNNNSQKFNANISNIKFIANHPFIYYFRLVQTNAILLIGYYE